MSQRVLWWMMMAALVLGPLNLVHGQESAATPAVDFNRQVRPILSENCFTCHGPDAQQREAELRFDVRADAVAVRKGRAAVHPGRPDQSEIIRRVTSLDPDERMPPASSGKSLKPQQIEILRQWIASGAEWDEHWAFVPPQRPATPKIRATEWCRSGIDPFVLARLEAAGLAPSPPADRAAWLRRVTLDLTGLPPTTIEVADYLGDESPIADARVVDRLLASPRYGEQMALEWLDAARFADTHGYFSDLERPMWPWRDWVIGAFNENMPFDRFTIEQLAGDLLPQATTSQLIASGFHRNQPVTNETGIVDEEYRVEYVAERADTTATVWLGLTAGCARCHDHKFDPWSQKEYYQLFAFFNQGPETGLVKDKAPAPSLSAPTLQQQRSLEALQMRKQACDAEFAGHEPSLKASLAEWERTAEASLPKPSEDEMAFHFDFDDRLVDAAKTIQLEPRGDPDFQPGLLGRALSFDGGRHLESATDLDWNGDEPWSVALWLRFSGPSSVGCVLSRIEPDGDRPGWEVLWRKGYLIVHLVHRWGVDAIEVWTVDAATANRWHHLVVSYDGSRRGAGISVFVDGERQELRIERDNLTGSIRNREPLRLGRRDSGLGFYGQLDELRGYRRVLTAKEIADLHRGESLRSIVRTETEKRSNEQRDQLLADFIAHSGAAEVQAAWQNRKLARQELQNLQSAIPVVMVAKDLDRPRETFILERGQYDHPGEKVSAAVPTVLPSLSDESPRNRLALARWLVDPQHPLTARVFVNRTWQHFFGAGLVRTPNDFGAQGEPPTHPELLDWLATEFVRSEWDVKALHRVIVCSATYRQSSSASVESWRRDPDNRLLPRGPRFRLTAETLRDQALAAAGLLVEELGGPSVKPYQPAGLWEAVSYGAEYSYVQDRGASLYRRGLYTYWKRQVPPPGLLTFDAPTRETCVVQRPRTNTPLQALVLLNDTTYVEAARGLAARMMEQVGNDAAACVNYGFLRIVGRIPSSSEVARLNELWERRRHDFRNDPAAARELLAIGESPIDGRFGVADFAAWTIVASVLLNLDETITKP